MAISTVVILFDMVWFRLHIHSVCRVYEYLGGGNGYSVVHSPSETASPKQDSETIRNGTPIETASKRDIHNPNQPKREAETRSRNETPIKFSPYSDFYGCPHSALIRPSFGPHSATTRGMGHPERREQDTHKLLGTGPRPTAEDVRNLDGTTHRSTDRQARRHVKRPRRQQSARQQAAAARL